MKRHGHRRHRKYPELIGWAVRLSALARDEMKGAVVFGLFALIFFWFFYEVSARPDSWLGGYLTNLFTHGQFIMGTN